MKRRRSKRIEDNNNGKKRKTDSISSDSESEEEENESEEDANYIIMSEEDILKELKRTDRHTYDKFMEVKDVIDDSIPDITSILNEDISITNKARLVELYEVFKMTDPLTEEWLLLKDRINMLINVYREEKININSDMENKHKLVLIEHYQMFSTLVPFSEDWFLLRNKLNLLTKEFIDEYNNSKNIDNDRINNELDKLDKTKVNTSMQIKHRILKLNATKENKIAIYKRFKEIRQGSGSEENNKLRKWVNCALELPHNNVKKIKKIKNFIKDVSIKLDNELFGMERVKEQILIFLNNRLSNPKMTGCCLGLKGPPGVGKTTIARILAKVMDWPFEQISFGGVSSADFLKGHDFTYVGSRPGEIVRCLTRMKYKNGILFFDEFEKVSNNKDILASLLHITDFQQNHEFTDNYLADLKIDLSNLWFIYSMNSYPEDSALRDRLYIIELNGYNIEEKVNILTNYVLPKILNVLGLERNSIILSDDVTKYIINKYDNNISGIRNLENIVKELISKINFIIKNNIKDFSCITFDYNKKLTYPITLNIELIDSLMNKSYVLSKTNNKPPFGMYL